MGFLCLQQLSLGSGIMQGLVGLASGSVSSSSRKVSRLFHGELFRYLGLANIVVWPRASTIDQLELLS